MKRLIAAVAVQLACVGLAVAPQLSARTTGDVYEFTVGPVDPIDPFRGAYVALSYPDLRRGDDGASLGVLDDGHRGDVFVSLTKQGDVWAASDWSRTRPAQGPYLACDDHGWQIDCGIESWFLPQGKAIEVEKAVLDETAIARVKIDSRGNAALLDVTTD